MSYLLRNDAFDIHNIRERRRTADKYTKNPRKSRSPNFFQNAKVQTCTHIKFKDNRPVAMPFKMVNEESKNIEKKFNKSQFQINTQYQKTYDDKQIFNSSSQPKPLKKYDAFCDRNRLPKVDYRSQNPYVNQIRLGNPNDITLNKAYLYATEYKARLGNHFDPEHVSNPGTIARVNLWHKKKLAKY